MCWSVIFRLLAKAASEKFHIFVFTSQKTRKSACIAVDTAGIERVRLMLLLHLQRPSTPFNGLWLRCSKFVVQLQYNYKSAYLCACVCEFSCIHKLIFACVNVSVESVF